MIEVISGNEMTCLTAEWSMVFPPFAKGGEGGFEPQGLTPPVKIPPNPPFSKGGDPVRFEMIFSGNHLTSRRWFVVCRIAVQPGKRLKFPAT
jgi:hypothetical protein